MPVNIYLTRLPWERTNRLAEFNSDHCISGAPAEIFEVMTTSPGDHPDELRHPLKAETSRIGHLTVFFLPHKRAGVLALCYLLFFVPVTLDPETPLQHPLVHPVAAELLEYYSSRDHAEIAEWIFTVAQGRELGHFGLANRFPHLDHRRIAAQ